MVITHFRFIPKTQIGSLRKDGARLTQRIYQAVLEVVLTCLETKTHWNVSVNQHEYFTNKSVASEGNGTMKNHSSKSK